MKNLNWWAVFAVLALGLLLGFARTVGVEYSIALGTASVVFAINSVRYDLDRRR